MNIYILSDKKVKYAKNLPIFDINPINTPIDVSLYDGLIFTSKNGILSLDKLNSDWKKIPSYAIAPQTAKIVKNLKGNLQFIGKEKYGDGFAYELINIAQNKKLLYVRGAKVVSNLTDILNTNGVICEEAIVYETVCKELYSKIILPKNSTIIFSSPFTIECFLKNYTWDKSFNAIAIGNTTATYFPPYITPIIAQTTSIESCVDKAIEIKNLG